MRALNRISCFHSICVKHGYLFFKPYAYYIVISTVRVTPRLDYISGGMSPRCSRCLARDQSLRPPKPTQKPAELLGDFVDIFVATEVGVFRQMLRDSGLCWGCKTSYFEAKQELLLTLMKCFLLLNLTRP